MKEILNFTGVVDIAGSGPVHLIGGASAFASAAMLGPRLGRYSNGINPLPLGSPVNACMVSKHLTNQAMELFSIYNHLSGFVRVVVG